MENRKKAFTRRDFVHGTIGATLGASLLGFKWYNGIEILDISDPKNPKNLITSTSTQCQESKMTCIVDNLILVPDGFNGLVILEMQVSDNSVPFVGINELLIPMIILFISVRFRGKKSALE